MKPNQIDFIEWIKNFVPRGYKDAIELIGSITDSPAGFNQFLIAVAKNSAKYLRQPNTGYLNTNMNLVTRGLPINFFKRKNDISIPPTIKPHSILPTIKPHIPIIPPTSPYFKPLKPIENGYTRPVLFPVPPVSYTLPFKPVLPRNGTPAIITEVPGLDPIELITTKEINQQKFLQWVKRNHPALYSAAISRAGTLTGWFDWFGDVTDALKDIAPDYLKFKAQEQMLDIQMERARQGQEPLPDQPGYQPGYQPGTQPRPGIDWKQIMPWLLGSGVLLGFMMMRR